NAGAVEALPALKPYLKDSVPDLRAVAVFALRFIETEEVDDLLARVLLEDEVAGVREHAASALEDRQPSGTTISAQLRAFDKDPALEVRRKILENLWAARESHPAARRAVEDAAAKDSDAKIRARAVELMKTCCGPAN